MGQQQQQQGVVGAGGQARLPAEVKVTSVPCEEDPAWEWPDPRYGPKTCSTLEHNLLCKRLKLAGKRNFKCQQNRENATSQISVRKD